jgi:microcystin degradation protein MlrC
MHGAMVAEGYDDCESDLLAHVRKVVGPDVPVGVELDLHCNIGEGTMRDATVLVLFKEYPHVDVPERADDLFTVMEGAIEGRTRPVMEAWDCRMIGVFHTTRQPMRGFVDKLRGMEGRTACVALDRPGFPWSDIKEMAARSLPCRRRQGEGREARRELGREFFALRERTQPPYVTLDAAMARVSSHNLPKPMILADVSDNAGGGAASDSTFILRALLDRKVKDAAIAMFWDPGAVKLAFEVGEGAELDIRLGGKLGPQSGPPIDARAKVLKVGKELTIQFGGARKGTNPIGDATALQIEGVTVIVNSKRSQCHSLDCFTKLGVDPSAKKVVVVKSMQHFHAAYAPIASRSSCRGAGRWCQAGHCCLYQGRQAQWRSPIRTPPEAADHSQCDSEPVISRAPDGRYSHSSITISRLQPIRKEMPAPHSSRRTCHDPEPAEVGHGSGGRWSPGAVVAVAERPARRHPRKAAARQAGDMSTLLRRRGDAGRRLAGRIARARCRDTAKIWMSRQPGRGPTMTRPTRSLSACSQRVPGCRRAAQTMVAASSRWSPMSPSPSHPVTGVPANLDGKPAERRPAASLKTAGKAASERGPASSARCGLRGSARRKSWRNARARAAMAPAISTPVDPPPTTTVRRRRRAPLSPPRPVRNSEDAAADVWRLHLLQPGRDGFPFVMAEIAWRAPVAILRWS